MPNWAIWIASGKHAAESACCLRDIEDDRNAVAMAGWPIEAAWRHRDAPGTERAGEDGTRDGEMV